MIRDGLKGIEYASVECASRGKSFLEVTVVAIYIIIYSCFQIIIRNILQIILKKINLESTGPLELIGRHSPKYTHDCHPDTSCDMPIFLDYDTDPDVGSG